MKTILLQIIFVCTIFSVAQINNAAELSEDVKECLSKSRKVLKHMMKQFNVCNKELGSHEKSGQEYVDSIGCVVKCVMKKENVLDDKDIMTEETVKKAVEARVPEKFRQHVHDTIITCVKSHGADKLDPSDKNCKSYNDLGTCIQEAVADVCGTLPVL